MRRITLTIILLFSSTTADAASYEKTDGTIVDPIQSVDGGDLSYSGSNVEPGALLIDADLNNANLRYANLEGANLEGVTLIKADLTGANLKNSNPNGVDLTEAQLYEANLTNANLLNAKLEFTDLTDATLNNVNLYQADLSNAILSNADLKGAALVGANLDNANLDSADLTSAALNNAYLYGANFSNAKLEDAIFTGAFSPPSTSSQLALTPLEETIIGGAQLDEAIFVESDLSGAVFDHENDAYDATGWETATWTGASFHYLKPALFPTGMIHTDHGIVVRTPEPSTLLLALIGLALVPRRRRRTVAIKTLTTLKTV